MPDTTALPQIAERVVPSPGPDGTAAAWSAYHWARARGWSLTVDDLVARDDAGPRTLAQVTSLFIAEVRIAYLVDAVIEAGNDSLPAADPPYATRALQGLQRQLGNPEDLDAVIAARLRLRGIDPERIGRYQHAGDHPENLPRAGKEAVVRPLFREPPA